MKERLKARNYIFVGISISSWNFVLSWVKHEKSFITLGPEADQTATVYMHLENHTLCRKNYAADLIMYYMHKL